MTAYVDQAYNGWSHEEITCQDNSQEVSASQMLDHGSISFGRFAYETLSWERRSVFTVNKYREEFEKFKHPGLVAKKKAYFEEYYKRIRAMKSKALHESQQTEITLEYGGDSSISSQAGEEEETGVQFENIGGRVANDVVLIPEEAPNEVSMEEGKDCSKSIEVQIAHADTELAVSDFGSCGNSFEEHEESDNTICPHQVQHLDMDLTACSSTVSIEEPKQQDLSNLDNKGVSKEHTLSVTNIEPDVTSGKATLCLTNSEAGDVDFKPAHRMVPRKVIPAIRKYKDNVSVPKLKEPPGPARNGSKLESKTKPNIQKPSQGLKYQNIQKPFHGLKYPIQRTSVKSGNGVSLIKATANKVSRTSKPAFVASHGPLTDVHSNVTIPRPFSLATNKRAATPGSSEGELKLASKTSNQKSSSAVKGKDVGNIQGTSKGSVMTSRMKSRCLENRRGHEDKKKSETLDNQSTSLKVRGANIVSSSMKNRRLGIKRVPEEKKKPVALVKQSTSLKARGACIPGPVKARSLDLPPRGKFSSNNGADVQSNDYNKDDIHKEGRHQERVTAFCRANTKIFTPPVAKLRPDTKASIPSVAKMASSWKNNSSCSMRKPRYGEQSLDGKKPRQEKPRWR